MTPRQLTNVIVVDDKLAMAETLADGLTDLGVAATAYGSSRAAGHGPATVFLRVSDLAKAKRTLRNGMR